MKSIIYKIKVIAIIFVGVLASSNMQGQSDLGVVWQRNDYTTLESALGNITKQTNGTYLASGWIKQGGRQRGYVVQFNEVGEKLKEWILTPPNQAEWTDGGTTAIALLRNAFITLAGDMIAFGYVTNTGASAAIKGNQQGDLNSLLKVGVWVTKASPTGNVLLNRLDRGSLLNQVADDGNGTYVSTGYDYDVSNLKWFLIRRYNDAGGVPWDNYNNGTNYNVPSRWGVQIIKTGSNYIIVSNIGAGSLHNTNFGFLSTPYTALTNGQGCIEPTAAPIVHVATGTMSFKNDGGFWIAGRMGASNITANSHGWVMYEMNSANQLMECKVIQPISQVTTILYQPPLLLPGSTDTYVGTVTAGGANRMYLCTDINPGFTLEPAVAATGVEYPYNTALNTTSHTDGFFSCGQDAITKRAAIAKLSTCVNFKINNIPTDNKILVDHAPSININLPLNYEGAKGATVNDVMYDLLAVVEVGKVGSITPSVNGGELENLTDQMVDYFTSGAGLVLNLNRDYYDIADEPLVIKYILTIKDSYMTAGVQQSCGQTYVFYLRSVPQSEVVAMPTIVKDGQGGATIKASIKNVGQSAFANPFNITVYKDAVGNTTKHIYAYTNTIARNETADFKISIPNFDTVFAGATKIVVNFNDNGDGTRDQPERDEAVERDYEINL